MQDEKINEEAEDLLTITPSIDRHSRDCDCHNCDRDWRHEEMMTGLEKLRLTIEKWGERIVEAINRR